MDRLVVVRVMAEGVVASFRYPFFAQNVQPTLPMPPPATIYGHIASACGERIPPESIRFGYTFTHRGEFTDYEHLWFESDKFKMNPFTRHLLFEPRLTLYVESADPDTLAAKFRSPYYPVVLGRSQDLMTYTSVEVVELVQAQQAYFEGTLLPVEVAPAVAGGTITMTLARAITERRQVQWGQYAILAGRGRFPTDTGQPILPWVWADPDFRGYPGREDLPRGVWLHSFEGEVDAIPG